MEKCYKIIAKHGNRRTSYAVNTVPYRKQYYVGRFAHARRDAAKAGYGLCVFRTEVCALSFMRWVDASGEIWECEADCLYVPRVFPAYTNDMLTQPPKTWNRTCPILRWPQGTAMANKVKLIRLRNKK